MALGKERHTKAAKNWRSETIQSRPARQEKLTKETGQMFFNGFTLLILFAGFFLGFVFGVRVEEAHLRNRAKDWLDGETIEDHMKRDGWKL
jgi:hypothetical protein